MVLFLVNVAGVSSVIYHIATRADWERAQDIIGAAGPLAAQQRG